MHHYVSTWVHAVRTGYKTPRAITLVCHSTSLHLPQPVFKVPVRCSTTPITPDSVAVALPDLAGWYCTSPSARKAAVRLSVGPLSPLADLSATLLTGSQSGAPSQPLAALAVL
jgi:hypothetical protein